MDEIHKNLRFCISEGPIDISNMYQRVLYISGNVVTIYENDDLLSWRTLCGHLDIRFGLGSTFDNVVDLVDFFGTNGGYTSLILIISDMLMFCFEAWAYDLGGCLELTSCLLFLKYFEIALTSLWDFAGIYGEILSMCIGLGLLTSLLFLLVAGWIFRVNLAIIFLLSELDYLSVLKVSQLAL